MVHAGKVLQEVAEGGKFLADQWTHMSSLSDKARVSECHQTLMARDETHLVDFVVQLTYIVVICLEEGDIVCAPFVHTLQGTRSDVMTDVCGCIMNMGGVGYHRLDWAGAAIT